MYITDGSEHAIATLCGDQADLFDAYGLIEASDEEPIIVLFVSMTVIHCSGSQVYWPSRIHLLQDGMLMCRF